MESDNEELEKAQFFFQVALKSDEKLEKAKEKVDEKVKGFITLSGTLVPIIVAVGYYILNQSAPSWVFFSFLFSLACIIGSMIIGIIIQRPKGNRSFNPKKLIEKYKEKPILQVVTVTAATWSNIVQKNKKRLNSKEHWLIAMTSLICTGLIILAITFLLLGLTL